MGHQINYTTIPVDYNKSQIKAEMDERAWHDHWQLSLNKRTILKIKRLLL